MNIEKAKQQIKNAMIAYFSKDEFGEYIIPIERQRPVFLVGPPGIGKTAIMEQIAEELDVGLVTYSMTHHTRQSALGLPFISKKTYGGREYSVSEYTMSEIIASVYGCMENTGRKEGILFLDEINCVSETLAPAMLQFLQYKVFGMHKVPNGWIVVTAGNPPEFNKSVKEFDTVTLDRLKYIQVEADFETWKRYASSRHSTGGFDFSFLDDIKEPKTESSLTDFETITFNKTLLAGAYTGRDSKIFIPHQSGTSLITGVTGPLNTGNFNVTCIGIDRGITALYRNALIFYTKLEELILSPDILYISETALNPMVKPHLTVYCVPSSYASNWARACGFRVDSVKNWRA